MVQVPSVRCWLGPARNALPVWVVVQGGVCLPGSNWGQLVALSTDFFPQHPGDLQSFLSPFRPVTFRSTGRRRLGSRVEPLGRSGT